MQANLVFRGRRWGRRVGAALYTDAHGIDVPRRAQWSGGVESMGIGTSVGLGDDLGGFIPTSLPGCVLWLRSDMGVTTGATFTWADQSGNANNATQATAAKQPTYVTSGGGGNRPYLSFPGAGGAHSLVTASVVANQAMEYFVAARSTSSNPAQGNYILDDGNNNNILDQAAGGNSLLQYDGGSVTNGVTLTINQDFIVDSYFNGAPSQQQLNGGAAVSGGNPGTNISALAMTIGNWHGLTNEWGGFIYEIVVFSRQLTTAERLLMSRYMGALYAVTVP
jgi:hypothetical protein